MSRYQPAGAYSETVLYKGITTSDGVGGGTTLIDSALIGVNDFLTDVNIIIQSGDCRRETRDISSFTNVTGTITVGTAFSAQIVSGVTFAIVARMSADVEVAVLQADVTIIKADTQTIEDSTLKVTPTAGSLASFIVTGGVALGTPLPNSKSLYDVIALDRLDNATYGLSALETLVDSLETRSVTTVSMMEFHSEIDDIITLTTATANVALPDIIVADIPANTTIVRVIGELAIHSITDTSGALNAINGAGMVQIQKSAGGVYTNLITIPDNLWRTQASTEVGGMIVRGTNDAASEVTANGTYNLKFNGNIFVDGNNLELSDVQVILKIYFIAT